MCIVHNLYCGYSLSAYVIVSIIIIDQNKTFGSEKSARALPGQARVCRRLCSGAWWYSSCHDSNLNGLFLHGSYTSDANGVVWQYWRGDKYSVSFTEMKLA